MDKVCSKCGGKLVQGLYNIKGHMLGADIDGKAIGYKCSNPECNSGVLFESDILRDVLAGNKQAIVSEFVPVMINNIEEVVNNSKLSRKEIANALDVSEQRVSNILKNENIPLVFTVLQLAYLLDVKYEDLYSIKYVSPEQFYNLCTYNTDFEQIKELIPIYEKLYENKVKSNNKKLTKEDKKELKAEKKTLIDKATEIKDKLDCEFLIRKDNSILKGNWEKAIEHNLINKDNE